MIKSKLAKTICKPIFEYVEILKDIFRFKSRELQSQNSCRNEHHYYQMKLKNGLKANNLSQLLQYISVKKKCQSSDTLRFIQPPFLLKTGVLMHSGTRKNP